MLTMIFRSRSFWARRHLDRLLFLVHIRKDVKLTIFIFGSSQKRGQVDDLSLIVHFWEGVMMTTMAVLCTTATKASSSLNLPFNSQNLRIVGNQLFDNYCISTVLCIVACEEGHLGYSSGYSFLTPARWATVMYY